MNEESNMSNIDINVIYKILVAAKDVSLGLSGGAVAYMFDYMRARRAGDDFAFRLSSMIVLMLLGAFVAYLVGSVLDNGTYGRDAIIGLSGVTAYNIIGLAESKFAEWVLDKMTKGK